MKQTKCYRMDDTILGMIDSIKFHKEIRTDTKVIEFAITELYYKTMYEYGAKALIKDGDHRDK